MVSGPERRDHVNIDPDRVFDQPGSPEDRRPGWCASPPTRFDRRAGHHGGPGRRRDRGPLRRRHDDRLLGGVGVMLSDRLGIDTTIIRIGLVLFGLVSGAGAAAYVVAWLLIPAEGEAHSIGAKARNDRRGLALASALVPALGMALLLASALHAGWLGSLAWPSFVSAAGLILIWRNGSDTERALLRRAGEPLLQLGTGARRTWTGLVLRLVVGAALLGGGVAALTLGRRDTLLSPLAGLVLVLAAFVVTFGPWWLAIARDLVLERQARIRAEETANLAARVHDSVLQTLAMIQRHSADPQRVTQLARAQERELRAWLFEGRPPGSFGGPSGEASDAGEGGTTTTVTDAARRIQVQVEADHETKVELVMVGDCPLTDDLEALMGAGREATVNAAKWSGVDVVSLFLEVEPAQVSLFVRDRGRGFDPAAVGADRQGLAQSIKGRMARAGGCAAIRSAPGHGTEVELSMPRRRSEPAAHRAVRIPGR